MLFHFAINLYIYTYILQYFKDCQPFYTDEQIDEVRCEVARYIFLAAP